MGDLGELLELLHGASDSVGTVYAEYARRAARKPTVRFRAQSAAPSWHFDASPAGPNDGTMKVWAILPDWVRVDVAEPHEAGRRLVRRGNEWRSGASNLAGRGVAKWPSDPALVLPPILDPSLLAGLWRLEHRGVGRCAGRHTILAHGELRQGRNGDDWIDLAIDAERGMVLARTSPSYSVVAKVVIFDAAIAADVFASDVELEPQPQGQR